MSLSTLETLRILTDPDPDSESGFHCVHKRETGWVAKALGRPVAAVARTPREAALDLAAWWEHWFGPDWPDFFAARMRKACVAVESDGGFRVFVYAVNTDGPIYLGKGQRGDWFPTKEAAKDATRRWIKDRFGMFARVAGLILRCRRRKRSPAQFPNRGSR